MRARAILFDLDETLIEEEASNDASTIVACAIARARYGIDPQQLLHALRARSLELWRAGPMIDYCRSIGISSREGLWGGFTGDGPALIALREWTPAYRTEAWARALGDLGIDDRVLAGALAEAFVRDRIARHIAFPESETVLRQLKSVFRLGLVTNGAPDIQWTKIRGSGLEGYFDTIVISGEVGVGKPTARIFEIALGRLGVAARETVMVGDSLSRDVIGARSVGLGSIWVNRAAGKASDGRPAPDVEVADLTSLPRVISHP